MTNERPLRADAEQNRLKIIAAGAEVFAERGFAATLDDVAHRAGVGVGTVYRRFPDKESLLDAIFFERVEEVVASAEAFAAYEDAWSGLLQFLTLTCQLHAKDRALKEVMIKGSRHLERTEHVRDKLMDILTSLVVRAKEQGALRDDVTVFDIPVLMQMVGSAADYVRDVKPEAWQRYLTLLIDGLRRNGSTPLPVESLDEEQLVIVMSTKGH